MSTNTQANFKTRAQYQRWLDYEEFFRKLMALQEQGIQIFINDCGDERKLDKIRIEFDRDDNEYQIFEQYSSHSRVVWVGFTHEEDSRHLYIDESLKKLIKRYEFRYYEKTIYIK